MILWWERFAAGITVGWEQFVAGITAGWEQFAAKFVNDFITDDRWKFIADGLGVTFKVTLFAVIIGVILGFLVAVVRTTHDKTGKLGFLNGLCKVYLTVIRGTPMAVQLLIIYFAIFASVNIDKAFVAIIAFGINSGAYVAEIFRGGIMSVDNGQSEAGRSLGLNYSQTMVKIVMPQAFKNSLPSLGNELITLLKETSVCGFIGLQDVTRGGEIIRGRTYDAFLPLIAVAIIYLGIVMLLELVMTKVERRLRNGEK